MKANRTPASMTPPMTPLRALLLGAWLALPGPMSVAALPDVSDPAVAMETWLRLKGDTAGGVTYEWMTGQVYGIPEDGPSQPLFVIESVTKRQIRKVGTGYEERSFACRLYKDSGSGEYIHRFSNPFTGREVALKGACSPGPVVRYSPQRVQLLSDIPFQSTALGGPMVLELTETGDQVVIRRSARSKYVTGKGEVRRELSLDTFKLAAVQLADETLTSLRPGYSWVSVTQWMTIFDMADTPGRMLWSIDGRNYSSLQQMPASFRAALEAAAPGALTRSIDWSSGDGP